MIAVIFELMPNDRGHAQYLDLASSLRSRLETMDGFLSIERFESLSQPGKLLSLSFWRDEDSVAAWRNREEHRQAQSAGRAGALAGYRLRVAHVVRDYGHLDREQAPADSREAHEPPA
jgi:heme-degrading monooxygenase HmoA